MRKFSFRNMWLVAKREYVERVKTKAFLIITILAPVLILIMGVGPSAIMLSKSNGTRRLVVVAPNADLASAVKKNLEAPPDDQDASKNPKDAKANNNQAADLSGLHFVAETSTDLSDANKSAQQGRIDKKQIDGFLWLDPALTAKHSIPYTAASTSDFLEINRIRSAAREALMADEFAKNGVNSDKLHDLLKPYDLDATTWAHGQGTTASSNQFLSVFVLGFAMYIITIIYGMNVLGAVVLEKSNRIMEVLLSTLTPAELLTGKIFGVAAVSLTQIGIWTVASSIPAALGIATAASFMKQANFSLMTAVYFAIFFLLGYLIYCSLCAALGSTVDSEQEAQQFRFIVTIPLMFSFFIMLKAVRVPNDPLVVAASFFPLSSPLVMYARVVLGAAPMWQILLSIAILIASVCGVIWLCARIYRIGVLMYGKKPNLPEIIKWIKYA